MANVQAAVDQLKETAGKLPQAAQAAASTDLGEQAQKLSAAATAAASTAQSAATEAVMTATEKITQGIEHLKSVASDAAGRMGGDSSS